MSPAALRSRSPEIELTERELHRQGLVEDDRHDETLVDAYLALVRNGFSTRRPRDTTRGKRP